MDKIQVEKEARRALAWKTMNDQEGDRTIFTVQKQQSLLPSSWRAASPNTGTEYKSEKSSSSSIHESDAQAEAWVLRMLR